MRKTPFGSTEKPQEIDRSCGFFVLGGRVQLRRMTPSDLDNIMEIERASFSYPWSTRFFLQELKVECSRSLLAVTDGKTVGYIIYWLLSDGVDIHNVAVHPDCRRLGIGRALMLAVIEEAKSMGAHRVTLEVRKSNEVAQRLYLSLGFVVAGIRKGYYSDDGEDAVAMVLDCQGRDG